MDLILMGIVPAFTLLISLVIISKRSKKYAEGGVYSIKNSNGQFGMIKVLRTEKNLINILMYTKIFHTRPQTVQISAMAERPKHLKIKKKSFSSWDPKIIGTVKLKPREITRYLTASKAS